MSKPTTVMRSNARSRLVKTRRVDGASSTSSASWSSLRIGDGRPESDAMRWDVEAYQRAARRLRRVVLRRIAADGGRWPHEQRFVVRVTLCPAKVSRFTGLREFVGLRTVSN